MKELYFLIIFLFQIFFTVILLRNLKKGKFIEVQFIQAINIILWTVMYIFGKKYIM